MRLGPWPLDPGRGAAGYAGEADFGWALLWGWNECCCCAAASAAAHHGGAAAAAAAAPGVDPHPFGHGRAADEITTRVEADALYDIFNPADFFKEWAVSEVGRVADAIGGKLLRNVFLGV